LLPELLRGQPAEVLSDFIWDTTTRRFSLNKKPWDHGGWDASEFKEKIREK
jgi:hypothetical protein